MESNFDSQKNLKQKKSGLLTRGNFFGSFELGMENDGSPKSLSL